MKNVDTASAPTVRLADGTSWPLVGETEWVLRYGTPAAREAQRYHVARIVSAYAELVERPEFRAKLPMIRRAIKSTSGGPTHG